jgi:hypothetical protein
MQENNTTTIQSRSFVEIHLHLTKKSYSKTLVVIPSTKRNAKNAKKSLPSTSAPSKFQPITLRRAQISDLTNVWVKDDPKYEGKNPKYIAYQ